MESSRRALAFGSVKTRFKAFWNMFFLKFACGLGFAGTVFIGLLPPGGRLNYQAYNVDTKSQSLKTTQQTTKNH